VEWAIPVVLLPVSKSYSSILVLKKNLWVVFILLLLCWKKRFGIGYISYLSIKKIFRRNVEILRFRNNKLDECLSYSFCTQNAVTVR